MSTKQGKRPTLTMLASEKEVEQILDHEEVVYMLVAKGDAKADRNDRLDGPLADLLVKYGDVFPKDLPPGLPPFVALNIKLISFQVPPYQTKQLIVATRKKLENYNNKVKSSCKWVMCVKV